MRFFEHFPENKKCPICNTNEDKECFLMPIDGTTHDNICEAMPTHRNCIGDGIIKKLRIVKEEKVIYFFTKG